MNFQSVQLSCWSFVIVLVLIVRVGAEQWARYRPIRLSLRSFVKSCSDRHDNSAAWFLYLCCVRSVCSTHKTELRHRKQLCGIWFRRMCCEASHAHCNWCGVSKAIIASLAWLVALGNIPKHCLAIFCVLVKSFAFFAMLCILAHFDTCFEIL